MIPKYHAIPRIIRIALSALTIIGVGSDSASAAGRAKRSRAARRPDVIVLAFGGRGGNALRTYLVSALRHDIRLIPAAKLSNTCAALGLKVKRGKNLAQCARAAGAQGIVGGTTRPAFVSLAVYSAESGDAIASSTMAWGRKPTRRQRARVLNFIRIQLGKLPNKKRPPSQRDTDPPTAPIAKKAPKSREPATGLEFDAVDAEKRPDLRSSPPPEENPYGEPPGDAEFIEDPLLHAGGQLSPKDAASAPSGDTHDKPAAKPFGAATRREGIRGGIGLGFLIRNFKFTDAGETPPSYGSGFALALRFDLESHPAAFFVDNFLSDFFFRLHYQGSLFLESSLLGISEALPTTISEIVVDAGYRWAFMGQRDGPTLESSLGYGAVDLDIDWSAALEQRLPNIAYRFFLIKLGGHCPLLPRLRAHARLDYRFVSSSGQLESDAWYGPSSAGGLSATLGARGRHEPFWGGRLIATIDYTYTRFFHTFSSGAARRDTGKRFAGGAEDESHAVILSAAYAY